jgi:hypothetical protein
LLRNYVGMLIGAYETPGNADRWPRILLES